MNVRNKADESYLYFVLTLDSLPSAFYSALPVW